MRIIKCLSDCLLISSSLSLNDESLIQKIHDTLSLKYSISLEYRKCTYSETMVTIGNYNFLDVSGKDINNLFLSDDQIKSLGYQVLQRISNTSDL